MRSVTDFHDVTRYGVRWRGKFTIIYYRVNANPEQTVVPALGLIVGKNVGNAVRRNLVRRRLREIWRTQVLKPNNRGALVVQAGIGKRCAADAVVIRALPSSNTARFAELSNDVTASLDRLERKVAETV